MPPASAPHPLDAADLEPSGPWSRVEVHASLDSTNAEATRRPDPWRVVVAEEQRSGRGRLGRHWVTTPGAALAVSAVLPAPPGSEGWVPLAAGLAVHRAVAEVAGVATTLKWPNDVLAPRAGDRKVAGILCEWVGSGIVVGVGVNVDQTEGQLPAQVAASLRTAGAPGVDRARLLTAYLSHLAALHSQLRGTPGAVRAAYRVACGTIGSEVVVHGPGRDLVGLATGVDDDGRLCLRTSEREYAVPAGDVVHVRPPR